MHTALAKVKKFALQNGPRGANITVALVEAIFQKCPVYTKMHELKGAS